MIWADYEVYIDFVMRIFGYDNENDISTTFQRSDLTTLSRRRLPASQLYFITLEMPEGFILY